MRVSKSDHQICLCQSGVDATQTSLILSVISSVRYFRFSA